MEIGDRYLVVDGSGGFCQGEIVVVVEVDPEETFLSGRYTNGTIQLWLHDRRVVRVEDLDP